MMTAAMVGGVVFQVTFGWLSDRIDRRYVMALAGAIGAAISACMVMVAPTDPVAIVTGVVTVVIGSLPFLGLIVPNLVSMVRGDNLRTNIPWVFLTGIWIVTICDIIGRVVIMPFEVPVSLVLGVVGSAVFIFLLVRQRKSHAH